MAVKKKKSYQEISYHAERYQSPKPEKQKEKQTFQLQEHGYCARDNSFSPYCESQGYTDRELLLSPSLSSLSLSFVHQHLYWCTTVCLGKLLPWNSFIYCYLTPAPVFWQNQRLLAFFPSIDSLDSKTNKQPQHDQTLFLYQNLLNQWNNLLYTITNCRKVCSVDHFVSFFQRIDKKQFCLLALLSQ